MVLCKSSSLYGCHEISFQGQICLIVLYQAEHRFIPDVTLGI